MQDDIATTTPRPQGLGAFLTGGRAVVYALLLLLAFLLARWLASLAREA